ncbi:MAG: hypothetical protein JST55_04445 [Bacteroidetes bacterium]|nr:hypothetical protein [Bacteroidota bacterium]
MIKTVYGSTDLGKMKSIFNMSSLKLTNKPKGSEEVNKTSSEHIELLQTIKTRKRPGFRAGRLLILKTVIQLQSPRVEVQNKNELNFRKREDEKKSLYGWFEKNQR